MLLWDFFELLIFKKRVLVSVQFGLKQLNSNAIETTLTYKKNNITVATAITNAQEKKWLEEL